MATVHPSSFLRSDNREEALRQFVADLASVTDHLHDRR
jgi:hypothetical protein